MSVRPHYLDVTTVTDRNELAAAFGPAAAWQATIKQLINRAMRETNPIRKKYLCLMISNAETQLELLNEQ